ncbi:S8 family serine peptidase [Chitinophaga sp. SYP-B3965]|uniref:S8 family serine peptidase n=1 Tax=Chitinophaga sp. SYP-B3965 TaxID=2663120 RepID=UPI00129999B9|nr:S8 family serine peptidase [Chitinophaga sp. SYP-B3965]MRG48371.1 S8 family serine peptidase [Chitinophaga sp. SYP-B3965]
MSKGYSLHIGLNKIDPDNYPGVPALNAAVNDAVFWESYAKKMGYEAKSLHDKAATDKAVLDALHGYADKLKPGDILLLTYAGHGSQIANEKGNDFADEKNDQTWCLYNRELLDDELFEAFGKFKEGTRILIVSDSCHSGTMARALPDGTDLSTLLADGLDRAGASRGLRSRKLPLDVEQQVAQRFGKTVYQPLQKKYKNKAQVEGVKASVKLLAACQDDQTTFDGEANGVFTESFIDIFKQPKFKNATAETMIDEIRERYYFPRPNFFQYGGIIPSFDKSFPFLINIPDADKVKGKRDPDLTPSKVSRSLTPEEQWDDVKVKKNAQLVIETETPLDAKLVGGKDIEILEKKDRSLVIELLNTPHEHAWSAAHALQQALKAQGVEATVEPTLSVNPAQDKRTTREGDANNPDFIADWPPTHADATGKIGWHLDDDHSQLGKAQREVLTKPGAHVRIGHFDTGYIEGHIALPEKLDFVNQRSFINKEDASKAIDKADSGQDGHGLGTMTLLAGGKVKKTDTFDEYEGYIGGMPFAEVIPMRISESVVILNDKNFSEAIDYAIEKGCEVITMSMAGKPSNRMARAVNKAYEAGIVVVSAASNCWYKGTGALLPKCVMYPAAFERVIAATGAMYDHNPYDVKFLRAAQRAIGTQYMQGSWGPASRMTRALAAYTPNTPWASTKHAFVRSGGGTSSATPQVAAAAAIYIAYHREEMEQKGYYQEGRKWMKVEAVRTALYETANKDFPEWEKYYGNGILRAFDALQVGVPDESILVKAPSAESSLFGVVETIGSFFKRRKLFRSAEPKPPEEAVAMELVHLLQTDPQFFELYSTLDLSSPAEVEKVIETKEFQEKVLKSPYASNYLKEAVLLT